MKGDNKTPNIALCGSEGLRILNGTPTCDENLDFESIEVNTMKTMAFSPKGDVFAYCDGINVVVVSTDTWSTLFTLPRPRTYAIEFSPLSNFLLLWQNYIVTKDIPANTPNMQIYDIKTEKLVNAFVQKSYDTWSMQWLNDESLCARIVTNEIHFYEKQDLTKIVQKCHIEKLSSFEMASGVQNLLTYVASAKAAPCKIRLFKYPYFSGQGLAQKSFYKADKIEVSWNKKGSAVLVLSTLESSNESYYGEQGLYFMDLKGETFKIELAKNGPIYAMKWNPNSKEFAIVYGYIPSKVTLYNLKCDPIFDFGTGPRNICEYNPQGNMLCIAGFGNLPGKMEFWDLEKQKLINTSTSTNSTTFEWCPDGEHVLTATTAPRLRIDNGYKVWHYSGIIRAEAKVPEKQELWMAKWQPTSETYPVPVISYLLPANTKKPDFETKKVKAYVPPAARGKIIKSLFKTTYEPPSNLKKENEVLSKSALKNKKKRENKAKKNKEGNENAQTEEVQTETRAFVAENSTGDLEKDKKIRQLKKKIDQIEKLKKKQLDGDKLEVNQIEKITKLDELIKDLSNLQ